MATVTFPTNLGGDGTTVTDDANVNTGLANGGHRVRFVPSLSQVITCMNGALSQASSQVTAATLQASNAYTYANQAAASAATALNAPGTNATSATSITISSGSVTLSLSQTGKSFVAGQFVQIVSASSTANWMVGAISAFNSATGVMTVIVTATGGSGAASSWVVSPSSPPMLPSQSGYGGKALVTDGSTASWTEVYPSQSGNSGKSLTTNGATTSWVGIAGRQYFLSQS